MRLISSKNALDYLSVSAPRAWVKRMMAWMSVNDELKPFFTGGSVIGRDSIASIMSPVDGFDMLGSMADRDALIKKEWNADLAQKMLGKRLEEIVEDDPIEWSEEDEPRQVSAGVILFASDIDWEAGTLEGDYWELLLSGSEALFWDREELFVSGFPRPDYKLQLRGLSFPVDSIELFRPTGEENVIGQIKSTTANRTGRPQKWDWEGAMMALVTAAQHPDGLPTGVGAQAKIEKMMESWFVSETGDSPAPSQIRQHASALIARLIRP